MTRDAARVLTRKLLALAAEGSGASEGERRNAALAATQLVAAHGLLDVAERPAIDLDDVTSLSFRVLELEHLLSTERVAHAAALRTRDEEWQRTVEVVRQAERAAVREERAVQGRAGGEARAGALDDGRKKEIARAGAAARWAKWREQRGFAAGVDGREAERAVAEFGGSRVRTLRRGAKDA